MTVKKQEPPKRISTSQINCYATCPRMFQLKYIKHMKEVVPLSSNLAMNKGLLVHDLISKNIFDHHEDEIDASLKIAQEHLLKYSSSENCLTEHKLNGTICGKDCVGIYDKLFTDLGVVLDWKNSKDAPYKRLGFNTQAYIYALLYEQNFIGKEIQEVNFVFLESNTVYSAPVKTDKFRDKCNKYIQKIIDVAYGEEGEYPKKISPLCGYCSYNPICSMFK